MSDHLCMDTMWKYADFLLSQYNIPPLSKRCHGRARLHLRSCCDFRHPFLELYEKNICDSVSHERSILALIACQYTFAAHSSFFLNAVALSRRSNPSDGARFPIGPPSPSIFCPRLRPRTHTDIGKLQADGCWRGLRRVKWLEREPSDRARWFICYFLHREP